MKHFPAVFLWLVPLLCVPAQAQNTRTGQSEELPEATSVGPKGEPFHLPPSAAPPPARQAQPVAEPPAPQNAVVPNSVAPPAPAGPEGVPPGQVSPPGRVTSASGTGVGAPGPAAASGSANADPAATLTVPATPPPPATPIPVPTAVPTVAPRQAPIRPSTQRSQPLTGESPAERRLSEPPLIEDATTLTANRNAPAATPSPLWKVGGVVLTLLGLLALIVLTPTFTPFSRPQQALALAGIGCAGVAQIADTFAGLSGAASPAQCLLTLAGFGGIAASGLIDSHRNRGAAGVLWLSAAALVTHSISHGSESAGAVSGVLAIAASLCALALCAAAFTTASPSLDTDDTLNAAAALAGATVIARPSQSAAAPSVTSPRPAAAMTRQLPARTPGKRSAGGVARLIAVEGVLKGRVFTLLDGNNAAGGDAAALDGNKIHLPGDDKVSRIHAIVTCSGSRCTVADMKSENGVFLNGGQVLDERDLMNGDRLQIGGTVFLYQRV